MKFIEHKDGLYYYETQLHPPTVTTGVHTLIQTVEENRKFFVKREIEAADKARELYRKLGRPSQQKFEDILAKNIITNCPITVDDAKRALLIYGPDIATVKGKTTTGRPTAHVPTFTASGPHPSSHS
jgi:hypothetical protein